MKLFYHDFIKIPQITLDDSNNTHTYLTPDQRNLTSVTTMLQATKSEEDKKSIKEWRDIIGESVADYILKLSARIGRETHKLNENYLKMTRENNNYLLISHAHFRNFIPFLNKITKIYGIESKLFSYNLNLAGTADCIALYNDKLSIIDYKTKRSTQKIEWMTDYFIQTTAYAKMWQELTNQKIEQLVVLVSTEANSRQEFIATPIQYENALNAKLLQYNKMSNS